MSEKPADYHAYLLRLWREDGRAIWYASLQNSHDDKPLKFASPDQLWEYIQQLTQPPSQSHQE